MGAGTGMSCYGFPGGIGTASRVVDGHMVGVLLLCNFGDRDYLDVLEGRRAPRTRGPEREGSCIAVCATDAPLAPHQLRRLALRPLLGLARTGSYAQEGSGEIGLAFSTSVAAEPPQRGAQRRTSPRPTSAAHEAVYNCLVAARAGRAARRHDAGSVSGRRRSRGIAAELR